MLHTSPPILIAKVGIKVNKFTRKVSVVFCSTLLHGELQVLKQRTEAIINIMAYSRISFS